MIAYYRGELSEAEREETTSSSGRLRRMYRAFQSLATSWNQRELMKKLLLPLK